MSYQSQYKESIENPAGFWGEKAKDLDWYTPPQEILSTDENGFYRWFKGGSLNTSYLALDTHISAGRGDQAALIFDSPVTDTKTTYTYAQLRDEVALFAGGLKSLGVTKGERVIIYMPMIPQAVIAMLAVARLGAVHSVVFGGFAPKELAVRIDDAEPKAIVTASYGIEVTKRIDYKPLVDKAIEFADHKPESVVLFKREGDASSMAGAGNVTWQALVAGAEPADPVPVDATDPLYILYTSGTTGKPKGVVRDNGGHAVALKYSMKAIYDIEPGEVFWAASDVGWVVGHSYIVYGPLLNGCTTVVFEGKPIKTPDAGAFWRVISEYGVKSFFTAPTAFRAIKKEDPEAALKEQYDVSCLKAVFLAGERLDPPTLEWLHDKVDVPVIDHWWQTETGWAIVGNVKGIELLPVKVGSATVPLPGYDVRILDDEGNPVPANENGNIVVKLPLPPACFPTLWQDDARFKEKYLSTFPDYFETGDGGYIDDEGYVFIMGRVDDIINVAGHRLSTGTMEEIIGEHSAVAECAVIGIHDDLKGEVPVGFVILKAGMDVNESELEKQLIQSIREHLGAIGSLRSVAVVQRLPKTRSGKILRKTLREISAGKDVNVPGTIEDTTVIPEITEVMKAHNMVVPVEHA
ncbi:MAG: propionyl-CoA synthetase [Cellvibrionaceae bacterium]